MKRIISSIGLLSILSLTAVAQKYAFVDTEYIMGNIPSYKAAQKELDALSEKWQKHVEDEYAVIEKMYRDFQAEKILLTEELKQKKEQQIIAKEQEVRNLQKKYFGPEGSLFNKRQELIKPIQDEVVGAIKTIANDGNYAVIFDTSSGPSIIFSDPRYDKSDEVLQKLGYKN